MLVGFLGFGGHVVGSVAGRAMLHLALGVVLGMSAAVLLLRSVDCLPLRGVVGAFAMGLGMLAVVAAAACPGPTLRLRGEDVRIPWVASTVDVGK